MTNNTKRSSNYGLISTLSTLCAGAGYLGIFLAGSHYTHITLKNPYGQGVRRDVEAIRSDGRRVSRDLWKAMHRLEGEVHGSEQ